MALFPSIVAFGQGTSAERGISANELARGVVANELTAQGRNNRWMYRVEREEEGKKNTREIVQTARGSLDRLVAVEGRPLSGKEEQQERERLEDLVRNPTEEQRLEQTKRKDADESKAFFKLIPDALLFTYAGRERDLVKLTYRPDPAFQPPSREARVLQHMEGEMWVNDSQRRLVRIRGQLTTDVKFAGGLLGHLERGGHFEVEQRELLPGQWELTFMEVNMKGKALFFKTIAVQEKEFRSDFHTVPDGLTLAEAAGMLARQVLVAAKR